jgi:hypothetical protein
MDWMARDQCLAGARDFPLLHSVHASFEALLPQIKQLGCETDLYLPIQFHNMLLS